MSKYITILNKRYKIHRMIRKKIKGEDRKKIMNLNFSINKTNKLIFINKNI